MKKMFRFFTIAALAFGMTMAVGCGKPDDGEDNGGGNGGNDNGPAILLEENFDNGIPAEWNNIDADGDGVMWVLGSDIAGGPVGYNSTECAASQSYINNEGPLTPDNYLVTPVLDFAGEYTLTWKVCAQDASYPEDHYQVLVGTVENGVFKQTAKVYEETLAAAKAQGAWLSRSVSLKDYKGKKLAIAFRHCECTDAFWMNIDEVKVAK